MRYLHKPTLKEQFYAGGTYHFVQDGHALEGIERFAVYLLPDESRFIRIDSDWRDVDGSSLLAEALYQAAGTGGRMDRFVTHSIMGMETRRETTDFFETQITIGYDDESNVRQDYVQEMPLDYAVLLPMPTLIGAGALQLLAVGGMRETYRGFDSMREEAWVEPVQARLLAETVLEVDHKPLPAQKILLTGSDAQADNQTVWVDARGVLLRSETPDGQIIQLTDYAYKP